MNSTLTDRLYKKIKILNEISWENRAGRPKIDDWLSCFSDDDEKLHALFLLSQFMYFGSAQMRNLLRAIYRDLYKYRIIESIRLANSDTLDENFINIEYQSQLYNSRFLGIGNPSESGVHLLYFFRQENNLPKNLFINTHDIFDRTGSKIANDKILNYVFIDDFCGSGSQAIGYSGIAENIKKANPSAKVYYLMLFATKLGKSEIIKHTQFDIVDSVYELDESFKCFSIASRYFKKSPDGINQEYAKIFCGKYGKILMKSIISKSSPFLTDIDTESAAETNKLGFGDGQFLIGFHHNTPDNTLPIIWYDEGEVSWKPIFKRYNKNYGIPL